ncbi:MAG: hypothetical protein Ct9H300mP1_18680 [Planctomycetaceae bacterium]|nr:MAG: hypothetical protein Ct9H300mP1_18680 [Planctomycetaceae bacterium]
MLPRRCNFRRSRRWKPGCIPKISKCSTGTRPWPCLRVSRHSPRGFLVADGTLDAVTAWFRQLMVVSTPAETLLERITRTA